MPNKDFTLEDYLITKTTTTQLTTTNQQTLALANDIRVNIKSISPTLGLQSKKKEQQFEDSVVEYIKSPSTLKDISKVVGTPLDNESKDQFVERALNKLRDFLLKKFG